MTGIQTMGVLFLGAAAAASAGTVKGTAQCEGARDNRDAVVYLENVPGTFSPPAKQPEMDQLKMIFIPHVLPILVGTTVRFLNSDPVLHNVYTPSKAGDKFNLGTWPQGAVKSYTFQQPGEVQLLCNVHPEMEAWIVVLANPYFAKTGPDGAYAISGVPAGKYTLRVWHEKLKFPASPVEMPASGEVTVDVAGKQ